MALATGAECERPREAQRAARWAQGSQDSEEACGSVMERRVPTGVHMCTGQISEVRWAEEKPKAKAPL